MAGTEPRRPLHVITIVGLSTSIYAVSLAGVMSMQATSDGATADQQAQSQATLDVLRTHDASVAREINGAGPSCRPGHRATPRQDRRWPTSAAPGRNWDRWCPQRVAGDPDGRHAGRRARDPRDERGFGRETLTRTVRFRGACPLDRRCAWRSPSLTTKSSCSRPMGLGDRRIPCGRRRALVLSRGQ